MLKPTGQNKFTLVLDSSQIALFLTCPAQWHKRYVLRLVPVGYDPLKEEQAMHAGTYGHKLMDIYYRSKAEGLNLNDTIERCFAYNPDRDLCECGCPQDLHKEILTLQECQRCGKCLSYRPHPFPLNQDTRFLVQNRFKDYIYKWKLNDFVPDSPQHVEIGFSEPIYEDNNNYFVLEGRMDLIASLQNQPCLVDHKFQMSTHWLYGKSVQFKNYAMISNLTMLVINYVRLTKTVTEDTMSRDLVTFSRSELDAWKKRLVDIYFDIKSAILLDTFIPNWSACSGYGKTFKKAEPRYCWYRDLCEESNDRIAERKQDLLFKIKEATWRPW